MKRRLPVRKLHLRPFQTLTRTTRSRPPGQAQSFNRMLSSPLRSRATTLAAVLDLVLTGLFLLLAIAAIVGVSIAGDVPTLRGGPSARTVFYALGLVVVGVCIWTGTIGIKLLQLRSWARIAGIVTFGGFVLLSATSLVSPRGRDAGAGLFLSVLVTIIDITIVVLLLSSAAARDFATAEPPDTPPDS